MLKSCTRFAGRAGRREYWLFFLANVALMVVCCIVDSVISIPLLGALASLALVVPSASLMIRRLHDTNRSGWWLLAGLIPFFGGPILLVLATLEGTPGDNRFGIATAKAV